MLCDECQHPNGVYSDNCDYDAMTQSCRYNCAANYLEAEKAVKLLSQFCKGRTQQAARLKLHSACIGCGYEPLCSKWSGANTPIMWTFKEDVNG